MRHPSGLAISSPDTDFTALVDFDSVTVLHVDDDPDFVALTETFLVRENPNMDVLTATSGEEALSRLDDGATAIDCLVSDYQMPGMDGLDVLAAVRERYPTLPFILFTGKGSEEVAERAISAGVTDYLQKETGTDQYAILANRIENAVRKTRAELNGRHLLSAVETAREGIGLLDGDGRFTYVNQSYADTYGYDREELLGEHWERLYPEDRVDRVYEDLLPNVPEQGVLRDQTVMVTADGTPVVTDHALSYTPDGLMVCAITTLSEEIDKNGLLVDVVNALDDLLFFFDEKGTLEFWNEQVEDITGYTATELSRLTPRDFVHEDDRDRMTDYIWATREKGEARVEVRLQRESGETVPYEFISKRVITDRGDVIGRIGLGRDISERTAYEREIERQNERLEHFAEVLSHDLRNPLAVADGHLDAYRETGDERQYEIAKTALERMSTQITDILELAQSGDLIGADDYDVVDLATVAESAWRMLCRKRATLDVRESRTVETDPSRLQQLFENLFRNAVEHGGASVDVHVGLLADGRGFYVEDDGPGIAPDERDAVFEAGHSTKDGGTGFGLTTVRQLVDAHGWTVRVTRSGSGGARFEIRGVDFAADA